MEEQRDEYMEEKGQREKRPMTVEVIRAKMVTEETLGEILGLTPFEHHPRINPGDVVSVIFFHNGSVERSGTITIWHNREEASIKTFSDTLCGEWLEEEKVIVSENLEESWTIHGELVQGKFAMDINGVEGIFSCGEFYPM